MGQLASKSLADGTMEQCSGSCISLLAQGTHLASRFVACIPKVERLEYVRKMGDFGSRVEPPPSCEILVDGSDIPNNHHRKDVKNLVNNGMKYLSTYQLVSRKSSMNSSCYLKMFLQQFSGKERYFFSKHSWILHLLLPRGWMHPKRWWVRSFSPSRVVDYRIPDRNMINKQHPLVHMSTNWM